MTRSLLDHQADGIEYTLHSHGIDAAVEGGNISPRLIQFHIRLGAGVKFSRIASLSEELALALGVAHCRITRDGYTVKVEVPRPDPVAVQLFPLMRNMPGDLPELAPILGLDENGVPLLVKLSSPDISHVLITGMTGSGKTTLARSMIASLALQNQPETLRLMLIDPKRRGYSHFNGLPNLVCPVITDPLDALHRLKWAVRHMEKRDEAGVSSPMLVIFIDELAELMMATGREFEQAVARLTQRGREAGIHIVASTQKATAQAIGTIARSNFPTRIVGKVMTLEDARAATGVNGSGAEKLMGQGDFLLYARDQVTRLQAAHLSQEEMVQTVSHLGGQPQSYSQGRENRLANYYEYKEPETFSRTEEETPRYLQQKRTYQDTSQRSRYSEGDYQDEQALGVAERLAKYETRTQRRRIEPVQPEFDEPEQYMINKPQPSRNYEPERVASVRSQPPVNPVDLPTPPDYLDDFDDDDFQDYQEERPVGKARAAEVARPVAQVQPQSRPVANEQPRSEAKKAVEKFQDERAERVEPVRKTVQTAKPETRAQPERPTNNVAPRPKPSLPVRPVVPVPKVRTQPENQKMEQDEFDDDYYDQADQYDDFSSLTRDGGKKLIDTLKTRANNPGSGR